VIHYLKLILFRIPRGFFGCAHSSK